MPLQFSYDEEHDILEIEGIRFSGDLFRMLKNGLDVGSVFRLVERGDGVITIGRFNDQITTIVNGMQKFYE